MQTALAAAATLLAAAFALSTLDRWSPSAPPRADVDALAGDVHDRLGQSLGGRRRRLDRVDVQGLLPVRRHPQRAVPRPRHGVPAGRAAVGPAVRRRAWRCCRPSPPAWWRRRRSRGRWRPTSSRRAPTCSGRCPASGRRVLGRGGAGDHRRRPLGGVRLLRGRRRGAPRRRCSRAASPLGNLLIAGGTLVLRASGLLNLGSARGPHSPSRSSSASPCSSPASWWRPARRRPLSAARAAQELAAEALRQLVHEHDLRRALVAGEARRQQAMTSSSRPARRCPASARRRP